MLVSHNSSLSFLLPPDILLLSLFHSLTEEGKTSRANKPANSHLAGLLAQLLMEQCVHIVYSKDVFVPRLLSHNCLQTIPLLWSSLYSNRGR